MCWTSFKTIGLSSKIFRPSQKTLRPSWCPKLVTGLTETEPFPFMKYSVPSEMLIWPLMPYCYTTFQLLHKVQ